MGPYRKSRLRRWGVRSCRVTDKEGDMKVRGWLTAVLTIALVVGLVVPAMASHVIKVGGQCDRTGATKVVWS